MKIWEAIIYGILGGGTELLPISFSGHSAAFRAAFRLTSLSEGSGFYVRAAIALGALAAVILSFPEETGTFYAAIRRRFGRRARKRPTPTQRLADRNLLLVFFGLVPVFCGFIFLAAAERISWLPIIALLFVLNGLLLFLCCRREAGRKTEKNILLSDVMLIGVGRMLSVFPGLSPVGSSLALGQARGLSQRYNLKLTYLLTLVYETVAFFYYLIRAFLYGSFGLSAIVPVLLAFLCSAVVGYLSIQYLRYLLNRNRLHIFAYYCWDAAAIVLILALINI